MKAGALHLEKHNDIGTWLDMGEARKFDHEKGVVEPDEKGVLVHVPAGTVYELEEETESESESEVEDDEEPGSGSDNEDGRTMNQSQRLDRALQEMNSTRDLRFEDSRLDQDELEDVRNDLREEWGWHPAQMDSDDEEEGAEDDEEDEIEE
jgi:hypothetical protein